MPAPTVLVTGASSGIGAATARLLLERGWRVLAAARRLEAMEPLAALGAEVMALDVSDEQSRRQLADQVSAKVGALDALVNNAGYGDVGPVETLPLERARAMFDVNVFGLMGLTQQLLPAMRERGSGRIVNISSIAGRWVSPGAGWYGASKFALEALSDALRLELKAFGVRVVVVEPGVIATNFPHVASAAMEQSLSCRTYSTMMRAVSKSWVSVFRSASPPLEVARTIERALTAPNPQARYRCGHQSASVIASQLLPTRVWDTLVRMQMT